MLSFRRSSPKGAIKLSGRYVNCRPIALSWPESVGGYRIAHSRSTAPSANYCTMRVEKYSRKRSNSPILRHLPSSRFCSNLKKINDSPHQVSEAKYKRTCTLIRKPHTHYLIRWTCTQVAPLFSTIHVEIGQSLPDQRDSNVRRESWKKMTLPIKIASKIDRVNLQLVPLFSVRAECVLGNI